MNKMDLTPENLVDSEDESVYEAIPIRIRKERTTKAYKEKMSQDIETIDKYDNRRKVNIAQWRPIYMRLYMNLISKSLIYSLMILSDNVKNKNKNHNLYQLM